VNAPRPPLLLLPPLLLPLHTFSHARKKQRPRYTTLPVTTPREAAQLMEVQSNGSLQAWADEHSVCVHLATRRLPGPDETPDRFRPTKVFVFGSPVGRGALLRRIADHSDGFQLR
jgi:hypothetical protein